MKAREKWSEVPRTQRLVKWDFYLVQCLCSCSCQHIYLVLHVTGAFHSNHSVDPSVHGAITMYGGCFCNTFSLKQLLEWAPGLLNNLIFIRSALEHPFWCIIREPLCKLLVVPLCSCIVYWKLAEGKRQWACCYIRDLGQCLKYYTANRLLKHIQQWTSFWCIAKK